MRLHFTKMHGLGNDFIVFEPQGAHIPDSITLRSLADRRTGIGFDQALFLDEPRRDETDVYYRVFNADGDEVEQCGNGARCIASLIADQADRGVGNTIKMDSAGGLVRAKSRSDGQISVDMGVPNFDPAALPFIATAEAATYLIEVAGIELEIGAVSIGNPHAVIRVSDVETAPVDRIGPALEQHERFPRKTNVEFMEVIDSSHIRLRVYERGTGETRACGTGACAAAAVGRKHGLLEEEVKVDLEGGRLLINWPGPDASIWLTGPAERVFEGYIDV